MSIESEIMKTINREQEEAEDPLNWGTDKLIDHFIERFHVEKYSSDHPEFVRSLVNVLHHMELVTHRSDWYVEIKVGHPIAGEEQYDLHIYLPGMERRRVYARQIGTGNSGAMTAAIVMLSFKRAGIAVCSLAEYRFTESSYIRLIRTLITGETSDV